MKYLSVLRLGTWRIENTDPIELADHKFLEDLKRMKQLKFFSLQGLPTIVKLPDSVCELSNLIILDLKECNYLVELPADIGSLKSLTHLDITNCPLLTKVPKGICSLSKLEVFRGFVITELHVARDSHNINASNLSRRWEKTKLCMIRGLFHCKNNDACTLRDLLKLDRLRDLSLVVNISTFPDEEDIKVFKEMRKLRKLKILWERSICTEDSKRNLGQEFQENCLDSQQSRNSGEDNVEESKHLDNIEKLELWCLPYDNASYWLNPSEMKNLKKLYIVGGSLRKLHRSGIEENKWNVEVLQLKYLSNLDIQWPDIEFMFPLLKYLEKHQCDQLVLFPCDEEGVWRSAS